MAASTAAESSAALAYAAACQSFLRHGADTAELLAAAVALDPAAALPRLLGGLLACSLATPSALAEARAALAVLRGLDLRDPYTHALRDALAAACVGAQRAAITALARAAEVQPDCLITVKLHHALCFMAGDGAAMLATAEAACARAFRSLPSAQHGTLLGFEAFAREELGQLAEAEPLAERAVASAPHDPWAFHALLHVLEETPQSARGLVLARTFRQRFPRGNNFLAHLAWHHALFALAEGEPREALGLYDRDVRPALGADYRDGLNCVGLLVRLERAGLDVGSRWQGLEAWACTRARTPSLALADLHALVALLRVGLRNEADVLVARLADGPAAGEHGAVQRLWGAAVGRALVRASDGVDDPSVSL
jgi:tetratricopeptide (TPR) repeat protein